MSDSNPRGGGSGFLRGMLMTIGILIMTASGLCSAGMLVSSVAEVFSDASNKSPLGDIATVLGMIVIWGGVPFLVGLGIWSASRGKRDDSV